MDHCSHALFTFPPHRNFIRVSNGPELGAYNHKFFLRDHPHLAAQMFCKNARTMLAMASSTPIRTLAPAAVKASVDLEKPPSPTTVRNPPTLSPRQQQQLHESPLWAVSSLQALPDETLQKSSSSAAAAAFMTPFFGGPSSNGSHLLERQMMFLQQQKEQANRLLIERAMLLQQQQLHPARFQQEQERLLGQMMQFGMQQQQQRGRQHFNNRASAA